MEGCKPEDGCWVSVVDVLWSMDVVCAGPAVFVFWGLMAGATVGGSVRVVGISSAASFFLSFVLSSFLRVFPSFLV